jgi:flagellar hook-associated protein 1 FlgK
MANGLGSLYIGASGLQNAQYALNTTANNLANVDTTGYVRQQVRFADKNYTLLKQPTSNVNMQQSGLGVSIGDVVHARDIFLDKAYRQEAGRKEFYSVRYETVDYVEDLMQELNGEEFKESIEDLWQAFQEISTKPEVSVYQNLVLEKADLLVSRTQDLYEDFQNYQSNINDQIKDDVDRVNEIGSRIYELNLRIQATEAGGIETAMTLRDERDTLLDELGQYGTISVKEDATGFTYVDFEYQRFVDDNKCFTIGLATDNETGFYTPYWEHLSNADEDQYVNVFDTEELISTELNTDVGGIKSKLIVRGDGYGRYENLAENRQIDPDTEETTKCYSDIAGNTMMEVEAELDNLLHSIITAMNDIYAPNTTVETDITDGTGKVVIPAGTKILDVENCTYGSDGELPPRELFVRNGMDRYTETTVNGKTYYVYNEENAFDDSSRYAIGNVQVNSELTRQITLMPAYKENGDVDYDFAAKLAAAWEETNMTLNPTDKNPCTFEGYYNKMVGALATEGNTYQSATETLEASVSSYDSSRQEVIGVSSDEELTQMIKYQAAYNAASRYMTVISEMTELIVTGLI